MSGTDTEKLTVFLLEVTDCLRDLLGELIDLQPPDTQARIAELQVRLLKAVEALDAE
jgi:hypothetical protein